MYYKLYFIEPNQMPNLLNYIPADVFEAIPILDIGTRMGITNYIDFIDPVEMKDHAVLRGVDLYGRPFICIRVEVTHVPSGQIAWAYATFFQRYTEDDDIWMGTGPYDPLIYTTGGMTEKQCMLIAKLISGYRMRIIKSDWELYRFQYSLVKHGNQTRDASGKLMNVTYENESLELELLQ